MGPPDSHGIPRDPRYSGYSYASDCFRVRDFHPLRSDFPDGSASTQMCDLGVLQPRRDRNPGGLGCSPFARHYLGNHCCFLFLPLLRCFSSRRSPLIKGNGSSIHWVAPFGDPGIRGHLHLPRAYRSLSRPSSPSRAKASACCPFLLLSFCSYSVFLPPRTAASKPVV